MDREILGLFLKSGPARKYSVAEYSQCHLRTCDGDKKLLFSHSFLNNSILFKVINRNNGRHSGEHRPIVTLVYLPYDEKRPADGGESFIYSDANLLSFLAYKIGADAINSAAYDADRAILDVLDSLPTFSPLIIELAFDRASLHVAQAYLDLPADLRHKLRGHLKGRIRPLIVAAFEKAAGDVERAVEEMTTKLLTLNDLSEILPLVRALRLPLESAQETLSSWIGLTYFEYEYGAIQPGLKEFSDWMSAHGHPRESVSLSEMATYKHLVEGVRLKLRGDWKRVVALTTDYRNSYNNLIFKGETRQFSQFLNRCRSAYWEMGDILGRLEQTMTAWRLFHRQVGVRDIPFHSLFDFYTVLSRLHASVTSAMPKAAPGESADSLGFPTIIPQIF